MKRFFAYTLLLCMMLVGAFPSTTAFALDNCKKKGCFQGTTTVDGVIRIRGTRCVYFPCGPDRKVHICNQNKTNCDPIGATPKVKAKSSNCTGCVVKECNDAARILKENHIIYERAIMTTVSDETRKHRLWMLTTFFRGELLPALMRFSTQMTALAMHQAMIIGQFFDAKMQLETQRLHQELQYQAHRDYFPSEQLCEFGTMSRSLMDSEDEMRTNILTMSQVQQKRQQGVVNSASAEGEGADRDGRYRTFNFLFCDVKNNNWTKDEEDLGLSLACPPIHEYDLTAVDSTRDRPNREENVNKDIDYNRVIEEPRTLRFDLVDDNEGSNTSRPDLSIDEDAVMALGRNLYGHDVPLGMLTKTREDDGEYDPLYMSLRSLAAKRAVAQHSYNSIASLKASGSDEIRDQGAVKPYLIKIFEELGISNVELTGGSGPVTKAPSDADWMIGQEKPSYYLQLEVLAKRMYQNPDFFANLYDKPVNVQRMSAAMVAVERMLDHELLQSQQRQELVTAVLLSTKLRGQEVKTDRELGNKPPRK